MNLKNIIKINNQGCTRIVFVFKTTVWKIPRFTYSWEHFLKGFIANISEAKTWKYNSGKWESGNSHLLCPIKFASWGGWLIIMKKADVEKHLNEVYKDERLFNYSSYINAGFGGDDKPENYGYYENKLVKVDYGC